MLARKDGLRWAGLQNVDYGYQMLILNKAAKVCVSKHKLNCILPVSCASEACGNWTKTLRLDGIA